VDVADPANPKGWYSVGVSSNGALGWMKASDVLEWRQALLVSYTHPGDPLEGRNPVLMFKDLPSLKLIADAPNRETEATNLYQRVQAREYPDYLISMEPKRFVDITRKFYVLPIVRFDTVEIDGDEARYLQIAAAVPGARGPDTVQERAYVQQADTGRGFAQAGQAQDLKVNIVFVLDTTKSTQPYIDSTRAAITSMVDKLDSPELEGRIRFGLIGYRDTHEKVPRLEYTAKNFTPNLVDAKTFTTLLETEVKATAVGSIDYAEEVFAGVDLALRASWEPGALRFVVLVGDSSSHPKGHAQNTTGKDEKDLRREADDVQVHLFAIHLQDERAAEDHGRAEEQFIRLSRIRGSEESALYQIDAFQQAEFQKVVEAVTGQLLKRLTAAVDSEGSAELVGAATDAPTARADPASEASELVDQLWDSALIEYIGTAAEPPKDIIAWTLDRDLVNPIDRSLEVRVLVTREQLSSLVQAVDSILEAFARAELTQAQFFDALQSVSGQTLKRPEDIGQSANLADSGLLPSFVQSLPYKSDILSLTEEMYASMTAEQRSALELNLIGKLQQYRAINENVDVWQKLAESDPDSQMVYPLHLDYMP
jgi:hypothetical protein